MDTYTLTPTPKTPKLVFDFDSGSFEISGRSIPENSIEFYKPLMAKLENYIMTPAPQTHLTISLEYFNTSSSKCLVEIFRKMERASDKSKIKISWYYEVEDDDMLESGEDFKKIVKVPIELISVEE
ncbi:MAG: DUF1987 domain-containing protein [Bacteroidota bacterium]